MPKAISKDDLSLSIVDDFIRSDLTQISIDFAEIGLDTFIDEGIAEEIPIIGSIVSLAKTSFAIRDRIFIRKIGTFLLCLKNVTQAEKELFYNKLNSASHKKKVGDTLLLILDRLDDLEKPQLLARVFEFYIREHITFEDFRRLSSAIDIAFIDDLKVFVSDTNKLTPNEISLNHHNLLRSGLTRINGELLLVNLLMYLSDRQSSENSILK